LASAPAQFSAQEARPAPPPEARQQFTKTKPPEVTQRGLGVFGGWSTEYHSSSQPLMVWCNGFPIRSPTTAFLPPCCFLFEASSNDYTLIIREYNGNVFHFREDGYFNMTKAAKAFGKEAKEFLRLPTTVEYVAALEKVGISPVYEARQGRNGGTWGHPRFAVSFARWLDVQFAVFCDMVIDDILNKKAELVVTKPAEQLGRAT